MRKCGEPRVTHPWISARFFQSYVPFTPLFYQEDKISTSNEQDFSLETRENLPSAVVRKTNRTRELRRDSRLKGGGNERAGGGRAGKTEDSIAISGNEITGFLRENPLENEYDKLAERWKRWTGWRSYPKEIERGRPLICCWSRPDNHRCRGGFARRRGEGACRRYIQPQTRRGEETRGSFPRLFEIEVYRCGCCPSVLSAEAWLPEPFYRPAHETPETRVISPIRNGSFPLCPRTCTHWFHWTDSVDGCTFQRREIVITFIRCYMFFVTLLNIVVRFFCFSRMAAMRRADEIEFTRTPYQNVEWFTKYLIWNTCFFKKIISYKINIIMIQLILQLIIQYYNITINYITLSKLSHSYIFGPITDTVYFI